MNSKTDKPDANEFKIRLKTKLSSSDKDAVIRAIKESPKFSNYYRLQDNDWYQLRDENNQDIANPPSIEILLEEDQLLVMRPVDDKPRWTDLDTLKVVLENKIQEVTVTIENYRQ